MTNDRVQHVVDGLSIIACVALTIAFCWCGWEIIKWFRSGR